MAQNLKASPTGENEIGSQVRNRRLRLTAMLNCSPAAWQVEEMTAS